MIIIGEKINGSIPAVADAIARRDAEFIKERARMQDEAGATYIDCCASVPEEEEVRDSEMDDRLYSGGQRPSDFCGQPKRPGSCAGISILQTSGIDQFCFWRRR